MYSIIKSLPLIIFLLISTSFIFVVSSLGAPQLLNYQGTLFDDNGTPINGKKMIVFKIYDSEENDGNILWESAERSVDVVNGIFNVAIEGFPNDLFSENSRYLAVVVEGNELPARKKLASVPYALRSASADYAQNATKADVAEKLEDSNLFFNSGNTGIGTTELSSGLKLDVEGKVGATHYCDQDGNNCKTITNMGSAVWADEYVLPVDKSGTFKCNDGYVVTGIQYDDDKDSHITAIYCRRIR